MKKYLMSGIAAFAIAAAFTSCSKSTDLYQGPQPEPTPVEEPKTKQEVYQEVFEKEFGKIDPNQNWGFVDQSKYVVAGTRGHDVNRNQWGSNKESDGIHGKLAIPVNVTPTERTLVYDYFNVKREGATNQNNINWTDYCITQVWKGEDSYYDDNQYNWTEKAGETPVRGELKENATKGEVASNKMNHLQVLKGNGYIDEYGNLQGDWEHANDFNMGKQNSGYGDIEGHTYMLNSGTLDFAYHNVFDSKYHNDYIIIPGAEIDPSLAGYWYVGFDFSATGGYVDDNGIIQQKNMRVERDWVFTDWIVRISPAEFLGQQRIFVEDLITTDMESVDPSDWDFNDAVFDAFMYDGKAIITLRAAGGTLNLTVGNVEVHQAFGVDVSQMVNTGSGPEVAPVQFSYTTSSTNAEDIPVVVTTKDGQTITLTAKVGEATQKIAAPIANHVKWLKERTHIKNGYPTFMDFVNDPSKTWYVPAIEGSLFQKWY